MLTFLMQNVARASVALAPERVQYARGWDYAAGLLLNGKALAVNPDGSPFEHGKQAAGEAWGRLLADMASRDKVEPLRELHTRKFAELQLAFGRP